MNLVPVLLGERGVIKKGSLTDMGEEMGGGGGGGHRKRPKEKERQISPDRCRQKLGEEGRI